jgi:hypothetical protein
MKTIAMYLPQFHRTPENDQWWGEGFTEWTAVRAAHPLFDGHEQPNEPLDDNYYDLMDKETMIWQAGLLKDYNVHGLCFYHYWFKDGRRILEKPAENLLKWTDIEMPFCFCWANESWARTWSILDTKNSWSNKFDKDVKQEVNDDGILLEQKYGREKNWKHHFDYLLDFFFDSRYIKVNNKPMFLFYKPLQIKCLDEMLEKWNEWAREAGFDGIYSIINTWESTNFNNVNAYLIHEPSHTILNFKHELFKDIIDSDSFIKQYSYDKLWQKIISQEYHLDKKTFFGGFVNYDDTPRHLNNGLSTINVSVDKFKMYFEELVIKNKNANNEYVFINAWNEWGEGMYLEPDKKNGHSFLMAIRDVMKRYEGYNLEEVTELSGDDSMLSQEINPEEQYDFEFYKNTLMVNEKKLKKMTNYFNLLNRWMYLKDRDKSFDGFFRDNGYNKIAIYGIGHFGKHLFSELKNSDIDIVYIIDNNVRFWNYNIPIKTSMDSFDEVDALIVTPIEEFISIKTELSKKVTFPIISLEEVLWEI